MNSFLHPLERNEYVRIRVYYDKGGKNMYGIDFPRGIYICMSCVAIHNGFVEYSYDPKFTRYFLIKETKRKDSKALAKAESLLYDLGNLPPEWRLEYLESEPLLRGWFNLEKPKSFYNSSSLPG